MKKTISIFILIFFAVNYSYSQNNESPIEISLEQLISHPKKYDKKYISVQGYVKFNDSGSKIFNTKEDFEKNNMKNCVDFLYVIENSSYSTVKICDEKYVVLTGFYNYGKIYDSENRKLKNGLITSVKGIKLTEKK